MSSLPLTFNNGQTETTSEISVVSEGVDSTKQKLKLIPFLPDQYQPSNENLLRNKPREKSYLVTTLIKDGVDENNRPLYKREIRSFNSVKEAKDFKAVVDSDGLNSEAFIAGGTGTVIATGSTKDGEKTFEFTNNATDWQKDIKNQIKKTTSKQAENIGRDEGSEVKTHTTEFAKQKVSNTKDNSIDAAENELKKKIARSGKGRKKYDNLFYPSFIKKSNQDKLKITILKPKLQVSTEGTSYRRDRFIATKTNEGRRLPYDIPPSSDYYQYRGKIVGYGRAEAFEREQDRIYAQGENTKEKEFNKEIIGSVTLPIPNGVSDQNAVSFGQGTLNPVQKVISSTVLTGLLEGTKVAGKDAGKIFNKTIKDENTKKALAGFIAGTASGIDPNEVLSRLDGTIFNNNLALLIKGPTLRPFTFQFNISPRDRGEAVQVQKIIRAFKQSSSVQKSKSEFFLVAPNTFRLEFFKGPTTHTFLPRIKECALLNVGVNYMPENSYMTYEDSSMVSYSLSLSFQELEPIFNSDFEEEDNNTDQIIGF